MWCNKNAYSQYVRNNDSWPLDTCSAPCVLMENNDVRCKNTPFYSSYRWPSVSHILPDKQFCWLRFFHNWQVCKYTQVVSTINYHWLSSRLIFTDVVWVKIQFIDLLRVIDLDRLIFIEKRYQRRHWTNGRRIVIIVNHTMVAFDVYNG